MSILKVLKKMRTWLFIGLVAFSSFSSFLLLSCNDTINGPRITQEEEDNTDNSKGGGKSEN